MKKISLTLLIIAVSFSLGYAFNSFITRSAITEKKGRVTSIGGIFFKCKEPAKLREWYKSHLGLNTGKYGTVFQWYHGDDSTQRGYTQWSPFGEKTKYFEPSTKEFMINYRVENMTALVANLKSEGITVTDSIESYYSYGKFVHIMDLEGNKIELWEPNDKEYGKIDGTLTK